MWVAAPAQNKQGDAETDAIVTRERHLHAVTGLPTPYA
jgi:hypothetical protein